MVHEEKVRQMLLHKLQAGGQCNIFLYGVLTEACILQTVLDLLKMKGEHQSIRSVFLVDEAV